MQTLSAFVALSCIFGSTRVSLLLLQFLGVGQVMLLWAVLCISTPPLEAQPTLHSNHYSSSILSQILAKICSFGLQILLWVLMYFLQAINTPIFGTRSEIYSFLQNPLKKPIDFEPIKVDLFQVIASVLFRINFA